MKTVIKIGDARLVSSQTLITLEAALINQATINYGTNLDSIATYLVANGYATVSTSQYADYGQDYNLQLYYSSFVWRMKATDKNGGSAYTGALVGFAKSLTTPNWNEYNGKVLRFTYSGGSDPGSVKVVKVKTFKDGNIYTNDLVSGTPKTYSVDKISNVSVA